MADVPLLWASGARKEALDLLTLLWAHADPQMQKALGEIIRDGPPDHLLARIDAEERDKSRDRRIFDRLIVLQRLEQPILTPELETEAKRLQEAYPNWQVPEGEQAHFGAWIENSIKTIGYIRTYNCSSIVHHSMVTVGRMR